MKDYGVTFSAVRPEPIVIDEYSVWVHSDIKETEQSFGDTVVNGFEYNMVQYDKDEYIRLIDEKNSQLESQLTDTQLALCEVYELMI